VLLIVLYRQSRIIFPNAQQKKAKKGLKSFYPSGESLCHTPEKMAPKRTREEPDSTSVRFFWDPIGARLAVCCRLCGPNRAPSLSPSPCFATLQKRQAVANEDHEEGHEDGEDDDGEEDEAPEEGDEVEISFGDKTVCWQALCVRVFWWK